MVPGTQVFPQPSLSLGRCIGKVFNGNAAVSHSGDLPLAPDFFSLSSSRERTLCSSPAHPGLVPRQLSVDPSSLTAFFFSFPFVILPTQGVQLFFHGIGFPTRTPTRLL
eukprot:RCo036842